MIDHTYYVITPNQLTFLNGVIAPEIPASEFTFKTDKDRGGNHHIEKRRYDMVKTAVSAGVQTTMDAAINLTNIVDLSHPELIVLQSTGNIIQTQTDAQVLWLQDATENTLFGMQYRPVTGSTTELWGLRLHEGFYMLYITLALQVAGDNQGFTLKLYRDGSAISTKQFGSAQVRGAFVSNKDGHNHCSFTTAAYIEVPAGVEQNYEWRVRQDSGANMANAFIKVIDNLSQWTTVRVRNYA